jgi:Reverse transcriptase (RNA-dependent DNA polymerase)
MQCNNSEWCLKVVNKIYGQKQAGRVCYQYLTNKLINTLHFIKSRHDPCILWKQGCVIVIYTDDTLIAGPDTVVLVKIIKEVDTQFHITCSDIVDDFLGVNITYDEMGKIVLTQPKLIQRILDDVGLRKKLVTKNVPVLSLKIIHEHKESIPFNEAWHYLSIIGKLNHLGKSK